MRAHLSEVRTTTNRQPKVRESDIEWECVIRTRFLGGQALKLAANGTAGVPDRVIVLPGGKVAFVEFKRPGGKARPLQVYRQAELRKIGHRAEVIDSVAKFDAILAELGHPYHHG